MITTAIFALGNVLIDFSSLDFVREKYGDEMGLRIANALYDEHRWVELDRGVLTVEEVIQSFFEADPGIPQEYIRWCFKNIARAVNPCGYAIPWLRDVRKLGIKPLFLSNYSKLIMHAKPEVLNFLPLMDGGIFSCDVKLIKPDKAIFKLILEKYDLKPEECLFIDDMKENCLAAGSLGINYYNFKDYYEDRENIMKILRNEGTP